MILWFEKHSKISWVVVILISIFIFYVSSLSFEHAPVGGFGWKTIVYHFVVFFFLSLFLLISLIKGEQKKISFIYVGLILSILYGISDEIHQLFVPNRAFALFDILTNSPNDSSLYRNPQV